MCQPHVYIRSVGCEVIVVAKEGFMVAAPQFSPNGQSILAIVGTKPAQFNLKLLLFSIKIRAFTVVQLRQEMSTLLERRIAWSPNSRTVLCALTLQQPGSRLSLVAVDTASAAITYQRANMSGVCTHVSWGAAAYVALACTDVDQRAAAVYLCLAVGSPLRISLLHKVDTSLIITHLSCPPSGLLCSWVEVVDKSWLPSSCLRFGHHEVKDTTAAVVVAEFATGRSASVALLESPAFHWRPVNLDDKEAERHPAQAHWAPDGLSLFLLGKTERCKCSDVQRLIF